jgi:hypothetical protein
MTDPVALPVLRAEPVAEAAPALRPDAPQPARDEASPAAPPPVAKPQPDREPSTRLLIEDVGGSFVYTVLDRVSGHVIARIPRENVEHLAETEGYQAGAMVNTQA